MGVKKFQELKDQKELDHMAIQIYENFLTDNSPQTINISHQVNYELKYKIKENLVTYDGISYYKNFHSSLLPFFSLVFDDALKEVCLLMQKDPFHRFLNGKEFDEMIEKIDFEGNNRVIKTKIEVPKEGSGALGFLDFLEKSDNEIPLLKKNLEARTSFILENPQMILDKKKPKNPNALKLTEKPSFFKSSTISLKKKKLAAKKKNNFGTMKPTNNGKFHSLFIFISSLFLVLNDINDVMNAFFELHEHFRMIMKEDNRSDLRMSFSQLDLNVESQIKEIKTMCLNCIRRLDEIKKKNKITQQLISDFSDLIHDIQRFALSQNLKSQSSYFI